ncbi:unnamed protein product [Rhizopus stolonifer]
MHEPQRSFVYVQYPTTTTKRNTNQSKAPEEPKKKRQHVGYACDKCRERRVGCDRHKPTCGQCKDRYDCQYSNQALRLDNVSMRQRLGALEDKVSWLTTFVVNLEDDYRTHLPRLIQHTQHTDSIQDWAQQKGWSVDEKANGQRSIHTNINSFEDLSKTIRNTMYLIHNLKGDPLYRQPSLDFSVPIYEEHSFGFFESLGRLPTCGGKMTLRNDDGRITNQMMAQSSVDEKYLEVDVMTRLIHQHHQCSFPTLVSPARFENHYRQGSLKPLVLSSIFSHSVPHISIYHPHLAQIQDFRELGVKFYDHSHDLLGVDDEPASISNIHQRTFLITYDLDHGRVRRAYLHLGIAIRMCFMLNLHRPEGYTSCRTPFEVEQSKRIFWTVWFYDNMVPQLFLDESSTMKLSQISVDLPALLLEFNQLESEQTLFAIGLIQIRRLAGEIAEDLRKLAPSQLVERYKPRLHRFYSQLGVNQRFGTHREFETIWQRRQYYCVLLDYCQAWITLYRALLPSSSATTLGPQEQEAILYTSQAAVAMIQLFESWFQSSPMLGFDCFFRPYLYHFMSAKHIFSVNATQIGRSSVLVSISRAYLALLLRLYQITPTKRSFDESHVENGLLELLRTHRIGMNERVYPNMIHEALLDDPSADGGWSIFSIQQDTTCHYGVFSS